MMMLLKIFTFILLAVHSKGAIRGATTNDSPYQCGSVLCQPVIESFTKSNLPLGYFFITKIPGDAWNLTVSQPSSSKNRLVLRAHNNRFIIDGEQEVSPNTTYLFTHQNNFFEYRRDNGSFETINTRGFLSKPVDLMILVRDLNPGVIYSYFLPIPTNEVHEEDEEEYPDESGEHSNQALDKKRSSSKFSWKLVGFGPCTKSCGLGSQPPIFRCVRDSSTRYYTPRRCMHMKKPVFHELVYRCNPQPCPGYWQVGEWSDCFCHNGSGFRERLLKCVQEQPTGAILQIENSYCPAATKPIYKEGCACSRHHRKKVHVQRSERSRIHLQSVTTESTIDPYDAITSVRSDKIIRESAEYRMVNDEAKENTDKIVVPKNTTDKVGKAGTWLMSDWNDHCSVECGLGAEHRSIFCDRSTPNTEPCDLRTTPDTTRFCESKRNCDNGIWFAGRWSDCAGDCFNLTKKRDVYCVRDRVIVDDFECINFKKPDTIRNCSLDEVHYCRPKWYYSDWTECSRSCGGGIQKRIARCLEPDLRENMLRESKECRYSERHSIFSTCNNEKCPEIVKNQRIEVIQNDLEQDNQCVDDFSNCHLINKEHVCKLNYYMRHCCATCSKY